MGNRFPPAPWTYETNTLAGKHPGSGFVYILDATGRRIAAIYCSPEEKIAVAEFICSASKRGGSETD